MSAMDNFCFRFAEYFLIFSETTGPDYLLYSKNDTWVVFIQSGSGQERGCGVKFMSRKLQYILNTNSV